MHVDNEVAHATVHENTETDKIKQANFESFTQRRI